jgi:hypothetical protein
MIRIAAAASGAWLLAGAVLLLPGMASVAPTIPMTPTGAMTTVPTAPTGPLASTGIMPTVSRAPTAPTGAMTVNSLAKGDRLDIRSYGPGCSKRGWPYYEASCIRNANAANRAKPVRIIAIDHLPPGIELAPSR